MLTTGLPRLRYHPDLLRCRSIVEWSTTCRCCERARSFVYDGPVYSEEDDLDDGIDEMRAKHIDQT